MLSSVNRLKKRKEFAYLYNHGTAKHTANLTLVYNQTKSRALKIGFSVAKKIGKAHVRNLVKRRLRAILREYVSKCQIITILCLLQKRALKVLLLTR